MGHRLDDPTTMAHGYKMASDWSVHIWTPKLGREHEGSHVTYPDAASNETFKLVLPALVSHFLEGRVQKLAIKLVQRVLLNLRDLLHYSPYF